MAPPPCRTRRSVPPVRASAAAAAALLGLALLSSFVPVRAMPMQYVVPQRGTECLYEKLEKDEHATLSVFIVQGAELRGTATVEGPVAPEGVEGARELQDHLRRYQAGERFGDGNKGRSNIVYAEQVVDFEREDFDDDDDDFDDDDDYDDDDDDEIEFDDKMTDQEKENFMKRAQDRRKRRTEERKRRVELRKKKKEERAKRARPTEGEPFQKTFKATKSGWYRACVRGSWYQITAEIEFRKSSELGDVDPRSGHVISYERRQMLNDEKKMDDLKADEGGIKEEDLETTREQLKKLNRLLNEIKEKQQDERHRLSVHAATNEHSHSRMVLGSLLETILFMAVTGFQVYTIRKWFSGAPMLGR
uniref:GOLD domain-containing protein n=1 Tax=Trieres chinensis TaxID=1514140 RepID=A0A7S1ZGG6_TRICV